VPAFLLACVAYLSVALPGSTLGLLWPSMRLSFGQPVGALGILLVPGIAASVISSAITGRIRVPAGPLVAASTLMIALALGVEVIAPSMWVMIAGTVLFGIGFGALDTALNAHASRHFGARDINWMHAGYGLGATLGPLLVTALLSAGRSWRQTYGVMALVLAVLTAAVAGVPLGAALMALPIPGPGSGALAVAGLMLLGLAAAPVFPLFTLTTGTTRMVSLQVAASAVGGAALPAGLGLAIGAAGPRVLPPSLLALSLAMGGLYAFIRRG